jgi:hypothetical protein
MLYTNIVTPYSLDFKNYPVGSKTCIIDEHGFSDPVSGGVGTSVVWSTHHINSEAEKAGITTITNMEEHYISIFFDFYHRRRLIIYGE